jgi:uncharacterized protein (TIGR03435 family)
MAKIEAGEYVPGRSFHMATTTMDRFAATLSQHLDHPVINKTGLEGQYSLSLSWTPEGARPRADGMTGPSIFAAVEEQLGLKLQRGNEETELLIIDRAEKVPTGN